MKVALQRLSSLPNPCESNPCMDYGRVVGNDLKAMKEMQRKLAKKLINDVIHLGSMEMLTVNHQVVKVMGSKSLEM